MVNNSHNNSPVEDVGSGTPDSGAFLGTVLPSSSARPLLLGREESGPAHLSLSLFSLSSSLLGSAGSAQPIQLQ